MSRNKTTSLVAATVALANAGAYADVPIIGEYQPGAKSGIYLANTSSFEAAHLSQALTSFTVDWVSTSDLEGLLNAIAPPVETSRRFSFKKGENKEAFLLDTDDERPIGAPFKVVSFTGTEVEASTKNRGLTTVIDHDEEDVTDSLVQRRTQVLTQRVLRSQLRRAVLLWLNSATNEDQVWSSSDDPDMDVKGMLNTSRVATGVQPNLVVYDAAAWLLREQSLAASTAPAKANRAGYTPEQLAAYLRVKRVIILDELYQAGSAKAALSTANTVYCGYVDDIATKDSPSNVKTFFTPCRGGGRFAVYREEKTKSTLVTVEHYANTYATSSLGMRKMTVSAS